mgnify:CR=1 FL=1
MSGLRARRGGRFGGRLAGRLGDDPRQDVEKRGLLVRAEPPVRTLLRWGGKEIERQLHRCSPCRAAAGGWCPDRPGATADRRRRRAAAASRQSIPARTQQATPWHRHPSNLREPAGDRRRRRQKQMQAALALPSSQHRHHLAFKGMAAADDFHLVRQSLVMGSLSMGRSTPSRTTDSWHGSRQRSVTEKSSR